MKIGEYQKKKQGDWMTLDKKIVAVIDKNLAIGIAFNTLAHLALILGKSSKNAFMEEDIFDATGAAHKGLSRYPFIILKAEPYKIKKIITEAKKNDRLLVVDFPEQAYKKYTDEEFRKALSKMKEENIQYYGAALFGPVAEIDNLTKTLSLWK